MGGMEADGSPDSADTDGGPLPAIVARAWGLQQPGTRGPRPGLSLERVVDAAIAVARTEGLAAVSMARVAATLGVSTMGLYRYVAGKNELLTLMVDRAWGVPPSPAGDADGGWREGVARWAWGLHAAGVR